MGFLHCYEISEAFIEHLDTIGPISVKDVIERYHHVHEMGYNTSEEDREAECYWACKVSVDFYMRQTIIEPNNRKELFAIRYLDETNITPDQLAWFIESAPAEDVNRLIIREIDGGGWDEISWFLRFDPIEWKLSDKALKDRSLIKPFWGVDI